MKVLAISHSCVTDVNQQQFVALNQIAGVDVALIVPALWRNDYTGTVQRTTLLSSVTFPVFQLPVAVPGHVSLHFYTRFPLNRLRHFRPDVLLSTQEPWSLSGLQAVVLARLLRVPLIFQTNQNLYKRYPIPFSWIESVSYRTAEVALAYSEEARLVMIRKGLKRLSKVVPYGTDLSLFYPQPNRSLRQKLGVEDKIVLGYMGRIVQEKGLDTLIEASRIILAQQPETKISVLIIGSGPDEMALRKKIEGAGVDDAVVFAGAVPHHQAGEYMNCIDVFVLPSRTTPSWKEQFGRVIIEAMACGIPVVGSDSGQIPILLRDTGGGLIFEEGNAEALASQLLRLINRPNDRSQLGQQGQFAVRSSYTYEAVAKQLYDALHSAVCSQAPTVVTTQ